MFETLGTFQYVATFAVGCATASAAYFAWRYARLLEVRSEAKALLEKSQIRAKDLVSESEARFQSFSNQIKKRTEKEVRRIEQNVERLSKKIEAREARFTEGFSDKEKQANEQSSMVDQYEQKVKSIEGRYNKIRDQLTQEKEAYLKSLEDQYSMKRSDVLKELTEKLVAERKVAMTKWLQTTEAEIHAESEREARRLLATVLNRFVRPYCPERGIGYLNFSTNEQRDRVLGPEQANLKLVEKLCGVDLVYDKDNNSVNVYGFDPVRRELGRATVEKMMHEKGRFDEARITGLVEKIKKDLFRKIMQDGERIAKELKADNLHAEIKNMMGALRYRYSFTQNQHFHCAEVGFLAGLLAAELDVNQRDARRSGLLHDLGKAMDHTQEGGHAVIGADFIEKYNEAPHIVHAVRAHHFDVQPQENLDYLVIAADAISGARPGARKSTAQTYSQKIEDLQGIAYQFKGVTDTHIVSAGREVRVYVDGTQVDDTGALKISEGIVEKIESEMAYPGQIKVTVVRSTQAVEYAR